MKPWISNKYLDAVLKTIICWAIIHLSIVVLAAYRYGNLDIINAFNISGLSYLFPNLANGLANFLVSLVVVAASYGIVFFLNRGSDLKGR